MTPTDKITSTNPLYAVVGAGDALVATVRSLPSSLDAAADTWAGLAERGEGLVGRVRGQQATKDLKQQADTARSQAKAAGTTARRSATQAKSAAKGAATSARKTADAAGKAASDAADKVGS